MHLGLIALIAVIIFVAELPDKTMFAALILGSRFPSFYVWLGASTAFFLHVVLAVTIGHFLTLLPHRLLEAIIAALFLLGAGLIFFGKHGLEDEPRKHLERKEIHHPRRVFATAFSIIFIGEWGDITQIATANYAAKYHDPVSVAIGATIGLWAVTALAVIVGTKALTLIPPKLLQRLTGLVLLGFAIYSAIQAIS